MSKDNFFLDIIRNLPRADIPIEAVISYLLKGDIDIVNVAGSECPREKSLKQGE